MKITVKGLDTPTHALLLTFNCILSHILYRFTAWIKCNCKSLLGADLHLLNSTFIWLNMLLLCVQTSRGFILPPVFPCRSDPGLPPV